MIDLATLKSLIVYDPKTGSLQWIRSKGAAKAGSNAGHLRKDGYRLVVIDRAQYLAHRLIWFYMTGEWPPVYVDHIDLDPSNLRWVNLRLADHSESQANRRRSRRNATGFKGVILHKPTGRYTARVRFRGKKFSLGYHDTAEEAHRAYIQKAAEIQGEFART